MSQPSPASLSRSNPRTAPEVRAAGPCRASATLITGAGGEVGHGLIEQLHTKGRDDIVAMDIRDLEPALKSHCRETIVGDICDWPFLERLLAHYEILEIYHLAALLSTRSEKSPETAHEVNVKGTLNLLRIAAEQSRSHGRRVKFLFPSSIAVYGLPDLATKAKARAVKEDEWCFPATMYGCNKLYCEHLGRYYSHHYRQLDPLPSPPGRGVRGEGESPPHPSPRIDFRAIRFPGIISAHTVPSGGTSDYAPEMIHAAAQGRPYACFVREDARIPFMTMPDAIEALLALAAAPEKSLSRTVYNVTSFNPSAGEIAQMVRKRFSGGTGVPPVVITFAPDVQRQAIVDSWPADADDSAARRDWGYSPKHDLHRAFDEYLVPAIKARYASVHSH
jgi:nucleoside-diphosphate-sugar epimerase